MRELILLKSGEMAMKGLNRGSFEDKMIKNCKRALAGLGKFTFSKAQSTTYVEPRGEVDMPQAVELLSRVFGIAALCSARAVEKDYPAIEQAAAEYLAGELMAARTFKVTAKRADKKFPMKSPEICVELGAFLLGRFPHLKVDVENPEVLVTVEIRDTEAYVHGRQIQGAGGIPVGTSGKAMLLLSGGIDSPVSGVMMAKRGLSISAVHFHSPPYTSERALHKVRQLGGKMARYCGNIPLYMVPFTEISEAIREKCSEPYATIIMRRYMMRIAEKLALANDCGALITGESVGQVASQTIESLTCTQAGLKLPVMRPVIGMDKEEIVALARKLDTFELSVQPYDDCCAVFTPKRPKIRPKIWEVEAAERDLDEDVLIARALEGVVEEQIDR